MDLIKGAERVEATTPSDLLALNIKLDIRTLSNLKFKNKTSPLDLESLGSIACFWSHRKIWQKIVDEGIEDAVILEDDVILKDDVNSFPNVSEQTPFAWLGLRSPEKIKREKNLLIYDRKVYGAHAYRLHASIVPLLLHHSQTLSFSVDFFMNEVLALYDIKPVYEQLVKTNEFMSKSDIEHVSLLSSNHISIIPIIIGLLLLLLLK